MKQTKTKNRPLRENYKHRKGSEDDRIQVEAAIGIMKNKDGTIEKRKF
jgi:hypothetical protein